MPRAADAVIVLGAAVEPPDRPGPAMRRRVSHGVRVLNEREVDTLVLSGGKGGVTAAEADVMWRLARELGVPDQRIVLETRSRNTFENAIYCGRIMMERGWASAIVVTDAWHMRRALFVFRRLGLPAVGAPVTRPPGVPRLSWARAYVEDAAAQLYSAYLFRVGAHKPIVEVAWER